MIGRTRWGFSEVESTQNVAFRLAELGAPHGTVVRANYQTHGRGRQGRSWESLPGSALMFSVLLRPERSLHALSNISILVADALADAFSDLTSDPIHIKWPNDVMIDGRKVSGILLQNRSAPASIAVLGIGINIHSPAESLPATATSLSRHIAGPIDSESLLDSILHRLDAMWDNKQPELSPEQIGRLGQRLWQNGEFVSLIDANREIHGRILGLAKSGGLRLSVDGHERTVMAGEIVRGPRPIGAEETA